MVKLAKSDRARVASEASAWLARIQGNRNEASERGLQDWLGADPAHREAFERATGLWEDLSGAARMAEARAPANDRWRGVGIAASVMLALGIGFGGYLRFTAHPTFATQVGQQEITALDDGTSVALNTDSKVTVLYSPAERRVRLDKGEALFDVTHNASRPFIVVAGDEEIKALGTSFLVRREQGRVAVTLVRGRVEISRDSAGALTAIAVLSPGQRATTGSRGNAVIDHPALDSLTAWRRGEVVFDDTRLADAAAELNRYGGVQLIATDPDVADLRVSGVFATNDAAEFANAAAQLNRLRLVQTDDTIELRR